MRLDSKLTIEIEGEGTFDNIESYRISSNYLTPTDAWEVVVYDHKDPRSLRRTFLPLRPVKLYLDGNLQAIGRIDTIEGSGETSLRVAGRDYIADLMDAGIDPAVRIKKNQTIDNLVTTAFEPWGITTLYSNFDVTRNALTGRGRVTSQGKDFRSLRVEDCKPTAGQGAFEWVNTIAARHGFTIQPSTRRDELCLCEPQYDQDPLYRLSRPGNILSARTRRDWSDVPSLTSAKGRALASGEKAASIAVTFPTITRELFQKNAEVKRIGGNLVDVLFTKGKAPTDPHNCYRPMYYNDKESKTRAQLERGLHRLLSGRLRKTLTYSCQLRGVVDPESGAVYSVDTIARVKDDIEDIDENLWIVERTLSQGANGAPQTDLQLLRPWTIVL